MGYEGTPFASTMVMSIPPTPTNRSTLDSVLDREQLAARYQEVRQVTESLCAPLEPEDYVIQSMPDASPAKWHLAHTSWFFETFVLRPGLGEEFVVSPDYAYLFNSYYNAVGERLARPERGVISRPTVAEVYRYRKLVDDRMRTFLRDADEDQFRPLAATVVLGLNHEQQHQELILTDLKHAFGRNPTHPVYRSRGALASRPSAPIRWLSFPAGLQSIGHQGPAFAFDNECPRHRVHVEAFRLANRLVTNREYLAFMDDGGYERPEFWLSDGWTARRAHGWTAPLYWETAVGRATWRTMTLGGVCDLNENEPVCHVSYYESDAFARWAGARLPTEAEWEVAAEGIPIDGNFLENECFHPVPLGHTAGDAILAQLFGDVWEWTSSPYTPYPGFRPAAGALGEYNGKFMCNQMILRGGSCATPRSHIRSTYRNFFPPEARWQFSGIRLAMDA
jgi:ergothioneine biosynthesis protein EgtB